MAGQIHTAGKKKATDQAVREIAVQWSAHQCGALFIGQDRRL